MKLRSHLLVLTLAVLLPVAVFGIATTLWVADRESESFQRGARERTLALLTAVDTELSGHVTSLQALATSYHLQTGDLDAFHRQSSRLLPMHTHWKTITLALPSGERVLTVTRSGNPDGRVVDRRSIAETVESGLPTIGSLSLGEGGYSFDISVPVDVNGENFVLGALVDPRSILSLLTPQRLQQDWAAVVLDQNKRVVARTVAHARYLGETASPNLQDALANGREGWIQRTSAEGEAIYVPYSQSAKSGWIVAMAIPAADVEAITDHTILLLAVGLLVAVLIAVLLAAEFSRRIAEPIVGLAVAAKALGHGGKVTAPIDAPVREVRAVSRALVASALAVGEREEKLRAADRAKDEFLAMLGHELRNPLGALTSATQVLNIPGSEERISSDAVAIVSRQVKHMTRIVDDLLDVGRATSGKVRLQLAPLDLGQVASQVARTLEKTAAFDELTVKLDASPVWIEGDEARIEQIVSNLLENASKYTPSGGTIDISVRQEGGDAVLEVADTGIGIAEDLLPRVFDLFVQGQRSIDRGIGGLGIGLTLVKRLTELHEGTVAVQSEGPGQGARFTVRLHAIAPPERDVRPDESLEVSELRKVLLIEDNADARQALLTMLRHYGFRTFAAADGLEGISAAEEIQPDAAIIDIGLPQYDGYEVARRLRVGVGGERMFLVALTGYSNRDAREKASDAGFDEYLIKPVSPQVLAGLIESRFNRAVPTGGRATMASGQP